MPVDEPGLLGWDAFDGFMVECVIEGVPGYSCGCRSSSHLPADKRVGVIGA